MGLNRLHTCSMISVCVLLNSCGGSGPQPPKPGTPEFFHEAAQASFSQGDLAAAHGNLDQLTLSDNPFRKDASVWLAVLSAGMARGAMEWADILEQGSKLARTGAVEYTRQAAAARKAADQHAMHLAELVQAHHSGPRDAGTRLVFTFPPVDANLPSGVDRVSKGMAVQPDEIARLGESMQRRGVALALCRLANTGADTGKAKAFLSGDVMLAPAAFEWYLAQELDALAEIYAPGKLDQMARARLLWGEAAAALAAAGDRGEVRALAKSVGGKLRTASK